MYFFLILWFISPLGSDMKRHCFYWPHKGSRQDSFASVRGTFLNRCRLVAVQTFFKNQLDWQPSNFSVRKQLNMSLSATPWSIRDPHVTSHDLGRHPAPRFLPTWLFVNVQEPVGVVSQWTELLCELHFQSCDETLKPPSTTPFIHRHCHGMASYIEAIELCRTMRTNTSKRLRRCRWILNAVNYTGLFVVTVMIKERTHAGNMAQWLFSACHITPQPLPTHTHTHNLAPHTCRGM